jgi:hypothetical protein
VTCQRCGLPAWKTRLNPDAMRKAGYSNNTVLLAPRRSERGNLTVNRAGLAVFTGRFPGTLERHRCPAAVARCKYCAEPVRILAQPPGAEEVLAVVDADPDPAGMVAVNPAGYAVRDPGRAVPGARYRWHTLHEAGAR